MTAPDVSPDQDLELNPETNAEVAARVHANPGCVACGFVCFAADGIRALHQQAAGLEAQSNAATLGWAPERQIVGPMEAVWQLDGEAADKEARLAKFVADCPGMNSSVRQDGSDLQAQRACQSPWLRGHHSDESLRGAVGYLLYGLRPEGL